MTRTNYEIFAKKQRAKMRKIKNLDKRLKYIFEIRPKKRFEK